MILDYYMRVAVAVESTQHPAGLFLAAVVPRCVRVHVSVHGSSHTVVPVWFCRGLTTRRYSAFYWCTQRSAGVGPLQLSPERPYRAATCRRIAFMQQCDPRRTACRSAPSASPQPPPARAHASSGGGLAPRSSAADTPGLVSTDAE